MITVILMTGAAHRLEAAQTDECMNIEGRISRQIKDATANDLQQLFLAFSSSACANNVEFSECANELLFEVIEQRPKLFFQTLFTMPPETIKSIKDEINNPIHDCINVSRRYQAVQAAEMPKELKEKSLSFLQISYESEKKMIMEWERKNRKKWTCP